MVCGFYGDGAGGGRVRGAELAWRGVVVVLVGCRVACPWGRRAGASLCPVRDFRMKCVWAGEGIAVWCGGAGSFVGFPIGGGVSCPGPDG